MVLKKEKLTFRPEGEQAEEDEDADYSYAERNPTQYWEKPTEEQDTTNEKNNMDNDQDDERKRRM